MWRWFGPTGDMHVNIWGHLLLSQVGRCYQHVVDKGQDQLLNVLQQTGSPKHQQGSGGENLIYKQRNLGNWLRSVLEYKFWNANFILFSLTELKLGFRDRQHNPPTQTQMSSFHLYLTNSLWSVLFNYFNYTNYLKIPYEWWFSGRKHT